MFYVPFALHFPDIAWEETRDLFIVKQPGSKVYGGYGLIELYCKDPKCDCRRVMFDVISEEGHRSVAIINFGWESKAFYRKWYSLKNEKDIEEMKGPSLNPASARSMEAQELLRYVKEYVLTDANYVDRLKRHYKMFKDKVKKGV